MNELWDGAPPPTATTTLQTYVSHLRKLLGSAGRIPDGGPLPSDSIALRTHRVGYSLSLPGQALDAQRFAELANQGRAELEGGLLENAADSLRSALQVWRGSALSDVDPGPVLKGHIARLEESRSSVVEERMDIELQLGRHHQVVGELTSLVRKHPTHEGLHIKLMLALHRSGRRSEALRAFQRLRTTLVDRLGLEPGPELQRLHSSLLAGGDGAEASAGLSVVRSTGWTDPPAQLPPDLPAFVGRAAELSEVEQLLAAPSPSAPPVVSVVGAPGSGKSAFCTHAANRVRARYPHGQLYADLADTEPAEVLAGFLRTIRGQDTPLPSGLVERSQLFRSWTAQRRVLVVLDNAWSSAQIAPLLPSGSDCAAIVACRRRVPCRSFGLMLDLRPLEAADSLELLTSVIGWPRVQRDLDAARTLVDQCAGLPLAMLAAATRLVLRPHWSISRLTERLAAHERRLPELSSGKLDIRASVEATVRLLTSAHRAAFIRIGGQAVEPVSIERAARLLGTDEHTAEAVLERLVEFRLADVDPAEPDEFSGYFRYRFHPLLRLAARAMSGQRDTVDLNIAAPC